MYNLLVTNHYPSDDDLYNNGFVHTRVKGYKEKGSTIKVVVYDYKSVVNESKSYKFEGIEVFVLTKEDLIRELKEGRYKNILVHFAFKDPMETLLKHKRPDSNIIIWVHGSEALSWKRRLFNVMNVKSFLAVFKNMPNNKKQLNFIRYLIENQKEYKIHFVFVSEWMKNIMETDTKTTNKITAYSIIPNPIDLSLFKHKKKNVDDRLKILSIRPYHSKKYANDITRDVIVELSKKEYFNNLSFSIYGSGVLFDKTNEKLKKFENVSLNKTFLTHKQIKKQHDLHGILLIPTRQDAQGVSMCEGISSGLVAVTTNNTAIPEYANQQYAYLCDNISDYVKAIEDMYLHPDKFLEKSKNTENVSKRLDSEIILEQEMTLFI